VRQEDHLSWEIHGQPRQHGETLPKERQGEGGEAGREKKRKKLYVVAHIWRLRQKDHEFWATKTLSQTNKKTEDRGTKTSNSI
jgi:hypothetical protein